MKCVHDAYSFQLLHATGEIFAAYALVVAHIQRLQRNRTRRPFATQTMAQWRKDAWQLQRNPPHHNENNDTMIVCIEELLFRAIKPKRPLALSCWNP
jgi:hypothetical protein